MRCRCAVLSCSALSCGDLPWAGANALVRVECNRSFPNRRSSLAAGSHRIVWAAQPRDVFSEIRCELHRIASHRIASHRIASHGVQRVVEELASGSARSRQRVLEDIRRITKRPRRANARGTVPCDDAACSLRKGLSLCDGEWLPVSESDGMGRCRLSLSFACNRVRCAVHADCAVTHR
jgi:hypothetical protein